MWWKTGLIIVYMSLDFLCPYVNGHSNLKLNHVYQYTTEHAIELTQSLNLARQEHIQNACKHLSPLWSVADMKASQFNHILIDEQHKLLYCYVPKVACTNWKRIFMILSNQWHNTDVLAIPADLAHSPGIFKNLSSINPEERLNLIDNYQKLIFVRNPFERLLSAYRNKLEGISPSAKYFQERVGKRIVKSFRKNPSNESLQHGNDVTFLEFVQFLTSKSDDFSDVIDNEHWQPIVNLCHPCLINYTLVGKYETLLDDSLLALHSVNESHIPFPQTRTSGTAGKLRPYYSQLPLPLIRKLYKLYKYDFRIFNYDLADIVGFDLA